MITDARLMYLKLILVLWFWAFSISAVDLWCGKAYQASDPAVDPGGRIEPPTTSTSPLLDLQIQPRVHPYLQEDVTGAFVVDAPLSYIHGQPYDKVFFGQQSNANINPFSNASDAAILSFDVFRTDTGGRVISHESVTVNSTGAQFNLPLSQFSPSFMPYNISIVASGPGSQTYSASTQLWRLPSRTDGGGVTKIDNLYGGLLVKSDSASTNNTLGWTPLLPYSYYLDGSWLAESPNNMAVLKNYGYNILHIVPAGSPGYNFTQLDEWLDQAQELGLWIMYDMRWTYQNSSFVEWQVNHLMDRQNMLLWYTADEPDGQVDPLDATKTAYDVIKSLDPYHPVSLCLNCANYYFEEYSAGADVLLSDVYPIGTNTSFSTEWGTVCNTTYGDCGCDDCQGYNNISNIAAQLDLFRDFQTQLGLSQKPFWSVPQAFGNSQYWLQTPTAQEEVAMTMLGINHRAKGVVSWIFPTTPDITNVTSFLAPVLTTACAKYLLGSEIITGLTASGAEMIDASAWRLGNSLLVSIVNTADDDTTGSVVLDLPAGMTAISIESTLWGDGQWELAASNTAGSSRQLQRSGMPGLNVDLLILSMDSNLSMGGVAAAAEAK